MITFFAMIIFSLKLSVCVFLRICGWILQRFSLRIKTDN
jgi:hypothetical protein